MQSRRPERARRAALALACAVLTGACVSSGDPGVAVNALQANIVFGLAEQRPAAPPGLVPPIRQPDRTGGTIPDFGGSGNPPTFGGIPLNPACPEAALTEFPDLPAEVKVQGMPEEGVYKFKRVFTITAEGGQPRRSTAFLKHTVRDVERVNDHLFTYVLEQPDVLTDETVVRSFTVNTNPNVLTRQADGGTTVAVVDVPGYDVVVPEPGDEGGIFLTKTTRYDAQANETGVFSPLLPVKYLPLDEGLVTQGQEFNSVGLDPGRGAVLVHQGVVSFRNRIDACGEIVEGFLVEAEQTFGETTSEYLYTIATQYGALFIGETIRVTDVDGTIIQTDLTLADPDPEPLPDEDAS